MLSEASYVDNFISEQHLEMNISGVETCLVMYQMLGEMEFLSHMSISEFFDFNVGIVNQSYHVEENICYDPLNAPTPSDVAHELLDRNPTLELQQ
ncbi:hypothetical protein LOAG_15373, partial [Loa loa]